MRTKVSHLLQSVLICFVRFWQICISPLYPPCCRFRPTCSGYMLQSLRRFGAIKGGYLGIRRLLRCHPFNHDEYEDPVPEEFPGWFYIKKKSSNHENDEVR